MPLHLIHVCSSAKNIHIIISLGQDYLHRGKAQTKNTGNKVYRNIKAFEKSLVDPRKGRVGWNQ